MLDSLKHTHLWVPEFGSVGGGIAVFSGALASTLIDEAQGEPPRLFGKASGRSNWHGCPVRGAAAWPASIRSAGFATLLTGAALYERPSLVISTHLNFGPLARAMRGFLRTPYVLVAHGIDVCPDLSRARLRALREADAVWAVSRWTARRLVEIGVDSSRIHRVPNTVSGDDFVMGPVDAELRSRYALRPDEKVVLTVARLDSREGYKGYDKVLRALPGIARVVGRVRYLVVGTGTDAARLLRLAADLGIADRLTMCGFVPDGEMAAHYRLADAFAMPSSAEGFGIVFLEAMACGVPVLAGNRDGSVDALADGELGRLVDPDDVAEIATGLIDLLERRGPAFWFDPHALRKACLDRFGQAAFRKTVREALAQLPSSGHTT